MNNQPTFLTPDLLPNISQGSPDNDGFIQAMPEIDPFDPRNWDDFHDETQEELRHRPLDFSAIEEQINDAIRQMEEENPISAEWGAISMGGPIEPYYPAIDGWNGLLLVGKAPGDAELSHDEPFTGKSGRLMDRILEHHGIDRKACMITNAFRMQPLWSTDAEGKKVPNDVTHFFTADPTLANSTLPALHDRYVLRGPDEHIRDLWRLVRKHKPKTIIAMGSIAAWALTGDGTLKGRLGEPVANACSATPVFLTYHPAYALHKKDEAMAALIAEHFGNAKAHLDQIKTQP